MMRTAAFGHGPGYLSACAKRGDYTTPALGETGMEVRRKGLGNEGLVPLGLFAALGKKMREEGLGGFMEKKVRRNGKGETEARSCRWRRSTGAF